MNNNNTCEKHCEATAFKIVIRGLEGEVAKLKAERKPLTDKAITKVIDSMPKKMKGFMVDWDLYKFTRAIEAKHGVKGTNHDATTE